MLRSDVIEIVNAARAWAFIGSGASIDSGHPTWLQLVDRVIQAVDPKQGSQIQNDSIFSKALKSGDFPLCFSRIEHVLGRERLEKIVLEMFRANQEPSNILKELAQWPFVGYVTSNYDHLLEKAIAATGDLGWASVGNSPGEVRKVSRDASRVVWHMHGGVDLTSDRSRLVLTEEDYDTLYNDSPAIQQLKGLLAQHRVVFVGFGFRDREIMRILKRVGSLTNPAAPLFAFLPTPPKEERDLLLSKYNVDTIGYHLAGDSHRRLEQLLRVHSSLILPRSLRLNQPHKPPPSYDPETTSVLIYNELALTGGGVGEDILDSLLKARFLSLLKEHGQYTAQDFGKELAAAAAMLGRVIDGSSGTQVLGRVVNELAAHDLISLEGEPPDQSARLTARGSELVVQQASQASLLSDQFSASLRARASLALAGDKPGAARVAVAAEGFLKECVERRALGVALAQHTWRPDQQTYQMVALLQALPEFMSQLSTLEEAAGLSDIVQAVLVEPSDAERLYIGLAIQARFGIHLLGYDPDALTARIRDFQQTVFLVDASVLIPFLAVGSVGQAGARFLIDRLKAMGSTVLTTGLLAEEVAEHARWAISQVEAGSGQVTLQTLKAATGRVGDRSNAFLEGFLTQVASGERSLLFGRYLDEVFGPNRKGTCTIDRVKAALDRQGISVRDFGSSWEGFHETLWNQRDEISTQIQGKREKRGTYTHERQVTAEAEALLIVRGLRDGSLRVDVDAQNGFFMSNSRVIDEVSGTGLPVTMRPKAALQWIATLTRCPIGEMKILFDGLVWDLAEQGVSIVDRSRLLTAFSSLTSASKAEWQIQIDRHRDLIASRYGEDAVTAFSETDALDRPLVLANLQEQRAEELEKRIQSAESRRVQAEARAEVSQGDKAELERLRAQQRARRERAKAKQRSAASRSKKTGRKSKKIARKRKKAR